MKRLFVLLAASLAFFIHPGPTHAAEPQRIFFTRLIAHWTDYGDPDYLKFVEEAKPEVAQVAFYGGHFWSLAHTPQYKAYPAHFPVQGLTECGDFFGAK